MLRPEVVLRLQKHGERISQWINGSSQRIELETLAVKQKGLQCLEADVLILSEAWKGRCKSSYPWYVKIQIEHTHDFANVLWRLLRDNDVRMLVR